MRRISILRMMALLANPTAPVICLEDLDELKGVENNMCWSITKAAHMATAFIAGIEPRMTHIRSAAAKAGGLAPRFFPDRDEQALVVAAVWLHDIGYSPALAQTGFHPLDGARWLVGQGQDELASLVAYHSDALEQAAGLGLLKALHEIPPIPNSLHQQFVDGIDGTTGPCGEAFTVDERIAEVAQRYGVEHRVTQAMMQARPRLLAAERFLMTGQ